VVLIHRFDVLGVDLHCHKFSSPKSSYFSRDRRFFIPISAQFDEHLDQDFSKKSEPAKAGLTASQRPPPRDLLHSPSPAPGPFPLLACARPQPPGLALPRPPLATAPAALGLWSGPALLSQQHTRPPPPPTQAKPHGHAPPPAQHPAAPPRLAPAQHATTLLLVPTSPAAQTGCFSLAPARQESFISVKCVV
jgi:hypothetical protein